MNSQFIEETIKGLRPRDQGGLRRRLGIPLRGHWAPRAHKSLIVAEGGWLYAFEFGESKWNCFPTWKVSADCLLENKGIYFEVDNWRRWNSDSRLRTFRWNFGSGFRVEVAPFQKGLSLVQEACPDLGAPFLKEFFLIVEDKFKS